MNMLLLIYTSVDDQQRSDAFRVAQASLAMADDLVVVFMPSARDRLSRQAVELKQWQSLQLFGLKQLYYYSPVNQAVAGLDGLKFCNGTQLQQFIKQSTNILSM